MLDKIFDLIDRAGQKDPAMTSFIGIAVIILVVSLVIWGISKWLF